MKIMILATGKIEQHEDSYAARLIEQGAAVLAPAAKKAAAAEKSEADPAETPAATKPTTGRTGTKNTRKE